ncbi:MAG: orotate phosphoribosyltransferase [Candidatus Eisenbacteria bacterium]
MASRERARLRELVREHALTFGDFVLSSGKRSSYYLDLRKITTLPEGAYLLARILLENLSDANIQGLGGPTIGADPIAGALAAVSFAEGKALPTFMVSKDSKTHGTGRRVEGNLRKGWRVAVIDDVVTTAGSILSAAKAAEEAGAIVERIIAVVDREEGGEQEIVQAGYRFDCVFRVSELLRDARDDPS